MSERRCPNCGRFNPTGRTACYYCDLPLAPRNAGALLVATGLPATPADRAAAEVAGVSPVQSVALAEPVIPLREGGVVYRELISGSAGSSVVVQVSSTATPETYGPRDHFGYHLVRRNGYLALGIFLVVLGLLFAPAEISLVSSLGLARAFLGFLVLVGLPWALGAYALFLGFRGMVVLVWVGPTESRVTTSDRALAARIVALMSHVAASTGREGRPSPGGSSFSRGRIGYIHSPKRSIGALLIVVGVLLLIAGPITMIYPAWDTSQMNTFQSTNAGVGVASTYYFFASADAVYSLAFSSPTPGIFGVSDCGSLLLAALSASNCLSSLVGSLALSAAGCALVSCSTSASKWMTAASGDLIIAVLVTPPASQGNGASVSHSQSAVGLGAGIFLGGICLAVVGRVLRWSGRPAKEGRIAGSGGSSLDSQVRLCPRCHTVNNLRNVRCHACGSSLDGIQPSQRPSTG